MAILQPSASPSDVLLMINSHCRTSLDKSCLLSLRQAVWNESATVGDSLWKSWTVCAICRRPSYTLFTTKQWNLGRSAAHIVPVERLDLSFNILTMFSSRIFRRQSRVVAKRICGADAVATKLNGRIQSGRVLCRSKDFNQIISEYYYNYNHLTASFPGQPG